jgi:hypothetical protein
MASATHQQQALLPGSIHVLPPLQLLCLLLVCGGGHRRTAAACTTCVTSALQLLYFIPMLSALCGSGASMASARHQH